MLHCLIFEYSNRHRHTAHTRTHTHTHTPHMPFTCPPVLTHTHTHKCSIQSLHELKEHDASSTTRNPTVESSSATSCDLRYNLTQTVLAIVLVTEHKLAQAASRMKYRCVCVYNQRVAVTRVTTARLWLEPLMGKEEE